MNELRDNRKHPDRRCEKMIKFKTYGTGRIEIAECRNAREFFKMIEDYDLESDDNYLFIQYKDGTHWFSGFDVSRPKKTNIEKAIFENDYVVIHYNGTVVETVDPTGYVYVEVE